MTIVADAGTFDFQPTLSFDSQLDNFCSTSVISARILPQVKPEHSTRTATLLSLKLPALRLCHYLVTKAAMSLVLNHRHSPRHLGHPGRH